MRIDQRREIQEQHQLYQKLMKISKKSDRQSESDLIIAGRDQIPESTHIGGRVIRSGPCTEITIDSNSNVELRDGVLTLTDRGKLIFLVGKDQNAKKTKKTEANLDGCKIKWNQDIRKLNMSDVRQSNPDIITKLGDRKCFMAEMEKLNKIYGLAESLQFESDALKLSIEALKEKMSSQLERVGPATQMTVSFSVDTGTSKYIRFANGITGRGWIDLIRGQKISLATETALGQRAIGWKTHEIDETTCGADRILPTFIGSICTQFDAGMTNSPEKKPENVTFYAYPSPAYDGSVLFWNGTEDFIQVTHVIQEDDKGEEPRESDARIKQRIHGRNVEQNISLIHTTDQGIWFTFSLFGIDSIESIDTIESIL